MFWPGCMKTLISPLIYEIKTRMIEQKIPIFNMNSIVFDIIVCCKNCLEDIENNIAELQYIFEQRFLTS